MITDTSHTMRFLNHLQEIREWPCYRTRPLEALRYTYSKWVYWRHRVSSPEEFLTGLGISPDRAFEGFAKWSGPLSKALADANGKKGAQGNIYLERGKVLYGVIRALRPGYV